MSPELIPTIHVTEVVKKKAHPIFIIMAKELYK